MVEIGQTAKNMASAFDELLSALKAGRFHHDGDPVLAWMAGNVVAKSVARASPCLRRRSRTRRSTASSRSAWRSPGLSRQKPSNPGIGFSCSDESLHPGCPDRRPQFPILGSVAPRVGGRETFQVRAAVIAGEMLCNAIWAREPCAGAERPVRQGRCRFAYQFVAVIAEGHRSFEGRWSEERGKTTKRA